MLALMTGLTRAACILAPTIAIALALSACGGPSSSGYDRAVLEAHPVAFWEMSARSVAEPDRIIGGPAGRYHGRPAYTRLPDGDRAAAFNGTDEYLSAPSRPSSRSPHTGELTVEAWIRPDAVQFAHPANGDGYVDWIGKCERYAPSCEWEGRMYSASTPQGRCNRVSVYAFGLDAGLGSGADWQPICGTVHAGVWLYVVGEYQTRSTPTQCDPSDPGTIGIWVDGVKQDFAAHAPTGCMSQFWVLPRLGSSPVTVGTMAFDSWFHGAVGKVAIYDRLLTQAQIDSHYKTMTGAGPERPLREDLQGVTLDAVPAAHLRPPRRARQRATVRRPGPGHSPIPSRHPDADVVQRSRLAD